jgi:hypothetical protein
MISEDISEKTMDKMIDNIAQRIVQFEMEVPAILTLESSKPLSWIGSHIGRTFVAPWIGVFGYSAMAKAEEYMAIFEDRKNVERLIKRIEELSKNSRHKK